MRGFGSWMAGIVLTLASFGSGQAAAPQSADLVVHADRAGPRINRQIFGQFAEHLGHGIYGGIWVGTKSPIPNIRGYRADVVNALKDIAVPVIRWPGGCFGDEYRWRSGVGPAAKRPVKVNTNWGGVTEDNAFGTHEYFGLLDLLGAESYVSVNVGSATPGEAAEWAEYMTSTTGSSLARERAANGHPAPWKVNFVGIGNELWGCGGNMRAEYAADVTKRFSTFIKAPSAIKIASGGLENDTAWTETMMREAGKQIDGYSLHYYTFPGGWDHKGAAVGFTETDWAQTLDKALKIDELIEKHAAVMDKYDPAKRIWLSVDEWGTWYDVEKGTNPGFLYQQNSLRDALVAATSLNVFVKHAERVKLTAIAQMVNVLQAMILTDGAKMVKTPTYYVYLLYKPFQDAIQLPIDLRSSRYEQDKFTMPAVSAAAARDKTGIVHIALANLDPTQPAKVSTRLAGMSIRAVTGRILTASAMDTVNSFDRPNAVVPQAFSGAAIDGDGLSVTLPPKSVVMLDLR